MRVTVAVYYPDGTSHLELGPHTEGGHPCDGPTINSRFAASGDRISLTRGRDTLVALETPQKRAK